MIRNRISLAIAAALLATVALAGCKKKDDMATATPPATTEPAPAPAPVEPAPAPMPAGRARASALRINRSAMDAMGY